MKFDFASRPGALAARSATLLIVLLLAFAAAPSRAGLELPDAERHVLDNGLTVILLADRNFPVVSVQMLYKVGARNEVTGKTGLAIAILAWSVRALPPEARGRKLVTKGPYLYVRHPLYAAFLGPFDLGLVMFLDAWPYLVWAIAQYPLWHWNVVAEERLMIEAFGQDYADYCRKTPRFLPKAAALAALLR